MSDDKVIADFLIRMTDLTNRKTDKCCYCGKLVTRMEKIGRCVYARPCGCRLWQGQIPDAWKIGGK